MWVSAAVFEISTQQVADTGGKSDCESRIRNKPRAAASHYEVLILCKQGKQASNQNLLKWNWTGWWMHLQMWLSWLEGGLWKHGACSNAAGSKLAGGQGSKPGQRDPHRRSSFYTQSRFMFDASVVVLLNDDSFCIGEIENFITINMEVSFENQRTGKLKVKCKISHFFSSI